MSDAQKEEQKRRRNETERATYASRRLQISTQELPAQHSESEILHFITCQQLVRDAQPQEISFQEETIQTTLNPNNTQNIGNIREGESQPPMDFNTENTPNPNRLLCTEFKKVQMTFRNHLDAYQSPCMCHICQESYIGMKVYQNLEGPICNRCKQERGINRLSAINNMDPGPQPPELACLTQVEEMLIAHVNPILQVTHAIGGQFKYKGHTISFPQHIEKIAKKLPHSITSLPIIIV